MRAGLLILICNILYSVGCPAQQNKSAILDIDLEKYIIDFSIHYIWKDDSLAIKNGRAEITEYLVSKQYFAGDSLSVILKFLGPPYKITTIDSLTSGYIYISNARLMSGNKKTPSRKNILNTEILQVDINAGNIITGVHRYELGDRESLIEYNR